MVDDIQRQLDGHERWLLDHDDKIRGLEMWRERAKGFIGGVGLVASLPSVLLGWMALTGRLQ